MMEEVKSKARQSVKTNVGVFGLVLGFLWQICSLSGIISLELLGHNYLQGEFPNWAGFIGVLSLGILILGGWLGEFLGSVKN
ncbi:hypothetical protein HALDL1_14795 [Halobacterium sp. DL1]|jgi:hypothetical protein|nr:hypothetical protein HALDL1_14795 [Halobacterium sp. DL1]